MIKISSSLNKDTKVTRTPAISHFNKTMGTLVLDLESSSKCRIGREASWPMRNFETFPLKQKYLYLSLVEKKEAEFQHNIDRRRYLVLLKWLIFITFCPWLLRISQIKAGKAQNNLGIQSWLASLTISSSSFFFLSNSSKLSATTSPQADKWKLFGKRLL